MGVTMAESTVHRRIVLVSTACRARVSCEHSLTGCPIIQGQTIIEQRVEGMCQHKAYATASCGKRDDQLASESGILGLDRR